MSTENDGSPARPSIVLPPAGFALLAALNLLWGLNWPFMKIALSEMSVWPFRSLCLVVGGSALLFISAMGGGSLRVPRHEVRPLLICTLFNIVLWHLFSGYGVSLMEAGRAAIIAYTMPVWAAILGGFLLREHLNWQRWLGLALGMAGLAILIGPDLGAVGRTPWGAVFMIGAAMTWALGTVLMKRATWTMPVATLAGWQLLLGGIPITLGAFWIDEWPDPSTLSQEVLLAVTFILIVPIIFCHWAWFKVVSLFPAVLAAIGTLAIPITGVLSSGFILGEPIGVQEILALGLVCTALVVVLILPALKAHKR